MVNKTTDVCLQPGGFASWLSRIGVREAHLLDDMYLWMDDEGMGIMICIL